MTFVLRLTRAFSITLSSAAVEVLLHTYWPQGSRRHAGKGRPNDLTFNMAPLTAGQKRKVDYNASGTQAQARKRQKGKDARAVTTQTADAALSRAGELNIASFIKSRDFEIAALEQSMKKSKKSLTQRAFQQLPRHMRRRTASHNVKKIPRRLRGRASREVCSLFYIYLWC